MTLTLAQARTVVLDHVDDDGTRWSTSQVDTALSVGLSQCLDDYISGGGDRFDTVSSFTSTAAGVIDMSTTNPFAIRGVSAFIGSRYFPIRQVAIEERNIDDQVIRTFQIRYCKTYSLPTNSAHPLVGEGATAALSWDVFDHWVCARAAFFASLKDAEGRQDIQAQAQSLAGTVMTTLKVPSALPFPGPPQFYSQLMAWSWKRDTRAIQIVRPA